MSILSNLINAISGKNEDSCITERPCANCPSDCAIAGEACSICEPYKRQLIDQIYYIDHIEEYYDRYEIVGMSGNTVVNCPYCGARSSDPFVCEYCGSKLSNESGKIRVEKASDIPNPIIKAQDIIYERADTVIKKYAQTQKASDSVLSSLIEAINGSSYIDTENPLGAKMSESEIKEAASLYGVSVSDYLTGLDNGKYLTLAGKKAEDSTSTSPYTGISGVAGIGMLAGAMLGPKGYGYRGDDRRNEPFRQKPPMKNRLHTGVKPELGMGMQHGTGRRGHGGPEGGMRGPGGGPGRNH